ncbi:hypothetical protein ACCO45_002989 [Purpureocillium lilacinum]|uniref:Uncharacterized protein n=1 Tax=Purpureocillium lilacinum TaxID=33203 RepID=A0ACC4E1D8_PURLI
MKFLRLATLAATVSAAPFLADNVKGAAQDTADSVDQTAHSLGSGLGDRIPTFANDAADRLASRQDAVTGEELPHAMLDNEPFEEVADDAAADKPLLVGPDTPLTPRATGTSSSSTTTTTTTSARTSRTRSTASSARRARSAPHRNTKARRDLITPNWGVNDAASQMLNTALTGVRGGHQ